MRARARQALLAATLCATGAAVVGLLAFEWPLARTHDAKSLAAFRSLTANSRLDSVATWIASRATPLPFVLLGAFFMIVALVRRRPRLALAVPIAMGGSNATTEVLKHGLAHLRYSALLGFDQISPASFPSGHATAAMSVALCAVLVSPPVLRPLAALLGAAFALALSYSVLILGWHYPSDVLGGFLVAGGWVALALAALWWSQRLVPGRTLARWPTTTRAALIPAGVGAIGLAGAFVASGIAPEVGHLDGSLLTGVAIIAGLAVVMTAGLAAALHPRLQRSRAPSDIPGRSLSAAGGSTPAG